jgi:hypothetical protein
VRNAISTRLARRPDQLRGRWRWPTALAVHSADSSQAPDPLPRLLRRAPTGRRNLRRACRAAACVSRPGLARGVEPAGHVHGEGGAALTSTKGRRKPTWCQWSGRQPYGRWQTSLRHPYKYVHLVNLSVQQY